MRRKHFVLVTQREDGLWRQRGSFPHFRQAEKAAQGYLSLPSRIYMVRGERMWQTWTNGGGL